MKKSDSEYHKYSLFDQNQSRPTASTHVYDIKEIV